MVDVVGYSINHTDKSKSAITIDYIHQRIITYSQFVVYTHNIFQMNENKNQNKHLLQVLAKSFQCKTNIYQQQHKNFKEVHLA